MDGVAAGGLRRHGLPCIETIVSGFASRSRERKKKRVLLKNAPALPYMPSDVPRRTFLPPKPRRLAMFLFLSSIVSIVIINIELLTRSDESDEDE